MSKPKVAVLMSSYNGEKFIKEQIDSILAQEDVDVTLYIRDDGSTDQTVEIAKSYIGSKKVKLMANGKNLRCGLSFMALLFKVVRTEPAYDYYAFADQDDIWLEKKIISAVEMIRGSEQPALYCSNLMLYRNGKKDGLRFPEKPELGVWDHVISNAICGCTMVMDARLAKIVAETPLPGTDFLNARYHDSWVYLVACVEGKVYYDPRSFILYRQHENNVIGVRKLNVKQRVDRYFKGSIKNKRTRSAQYLLNAFPETDFEDRDRVEMLAYYQKSLKNRANLILNAKRCKQNGEKTSAFIVKVILGYI